MTHYMTDIESAEYRSDTAKFNMLGAGLVPSKTKCVGCGNLKTTKTGKPTKSGFICHSCHSPRRVA